MDPGLYGTVRGCNLQEARLDVIANNLANLGTPGFKRDMICFDQALEMHTRHDFSQGNSRHTANPLDLALQGEGYFRVNTASGIRYTRNGKFSLNANQQLVTSNGDPLMGRNGPIYIQGTDIVIDTRGNIIRLLFMILPLSPAQPVGSELTK